MEASPRTATLGCLRRPVVQVQRQRCLPMFMLMDYAAFTARVFCCSSLSNATRSIAAQLNGCCMASMPAHVRRQSSSSSLLILR